MLPSHGRLPCSSSKSQYELAELVFFGARALTGAKSIKTVTHYSISFQGFSSSRWRQPYRSFVPPSHHRSSCFVLTSIFTCKVVVHSLPLCSSVDRLNHVAPLPRHHSLAGTDSICLCLLWPTEQHFSSSGQRSSSKVPVHGSSTKK